MTFKRPLFGHGLVDYGRIAVYVRGIMQFQEILTKFKMVKDFDPKGLLQLKEDTDEKVALKILARFFITLEESLAHVATSLNSGELMEVSKGSHKIAGSADLVGFSSFAQRSRKISRDVKGTPEMSSADLHHEVVDYLNDGKTMLGQMKQAFSDYQNYI